MKGVFTMINFETVKFIDLLNHLASISKHPEKIIAFSEKSPEIAKKCRRYNDYECDFILYDDERVVSPIGDPGEMFVVKEVLVDDAHNEIVSRYDDYNEVFITVSPDYDNEGKWIMVAIVNDKEDESHQFLIQDGKWCCVDC